RITLDLDERALLPESASPDGDLIYVATSGRIGARAVPDGRRVWDRELSFSPDWIATLGETVVVAGMDGAARLNAQDGRPLWQVSLPEPTPDFGALPGWRDSSTSAAGAAGRPTDLRLSDFQLAGGRLIARLGGSLLAIDSETGEILWQEVPGSVGPPRTIGGFSPHYHADAETIVVQRDGRRWLFDAATGRPRATGPAPADPWPSAPVALDAKRVAVVEDGRVVAIDRLTGDKSWAYEFRDWPSLTGEPAQLRSAGPILLVGLQRNDRFEIYRLDAAGGFPRNPEPLVAGRERVDLSAVAVIGDAVYFADGGLLTRLNAPSGRRQFPRRLDGSDPTGLQRLSWRADRLGATGLVLSPASFRGDFDDADPSEPLLRRGQLWVVGTQGEPAFEPIPFDNAGPHAAVRAGPDGFVVATATEVQGFRFKNRGR
ncbi:MAG TPA: PQQ-binding-like beta-propeller repeat protein, partial [Gemmataceae bacterium]|nr:PQQ-binding-like beta-propeller repeat protein [Gemmataceae bacterium]